MNGQQIQKIRRLRKAVKTAEQRLNSTYKDLREATEGCDHFDQRGRSAVERESTHHPPTCGGFKECAVCAGEQEETFVDVCQICRKAVK